MGLLERLGKEWLFFDGGSGTLLQERGLKGGEQPEYWNLTHPEEILTLHRQYLQAGADIITSNTFGANRFHYGEELPEVIRAAVSLAKKARKDAGREEDAYVALDIGPSGKLLKPMGDLDFEAAVEAFSEIVKIGTEAGADLVLIETMSDAYEAKAALLAAKENCKLPVFVTCTFDKSGKLLTGGTVQSLVPMLEGLGADAVGINCSLGPEEMLPLVKELASVASVPVIVNPNAGLPVQVSEEVQAGTGVQTCEEAKLQADAEQQDKPAADEARRTILKTVYPVGPEAFTGFMKEIALLPVQLVGGCCGTTPEHIRLLKETVAKLPFKPQTKKDRLILSSGAVFAEVSDESGCLIVGERINPTGKKRFQRALKEKDLNYILEQAIEQEDAGADILDVNVGLPGIDEPEMMEEVLKALQAVTMLPLQIDTSDPDALSRALRIYNGRPLINSVNGKEESMRAVFPLAKKYGAAIVALCLDESGIPETADGRIAVAEKILSRAEEYGIPRKNILIDGLTMAVSADAESAKTTLETIRRAKEKLGCHTILGVSNISFGLPARPAVNAAFLSMAMQNGLSLAIMNPNDAAMTASLRAGNALLASDKQGLRFSLEFAGISDLFGNKGQKRPDGLPGKEAGRISMISEKSGAGSTAQEKPAGAAGSVTQEVQSGPGTKPLRSAVLHGLIAAAKAETKALLKAGEEPLKIIEENLVPALNEVGEAYEKGRLYLPQLLMSADAAKASFAILQNAMKGQPHQKKGTVILATVKGDIHDIGKNIVRVMLENYGFEVIDLGKDVEPEKIAEAAENSEIRLVGLSALMTTTVPAMEETIQLLRKRTPGTKIMAGGAVLTEEYAKRIGADAYGKDAMAAVRYAESVFAE